MWTTDADGTRRYFGVTDPSPMDCVILSMYAQIHWLNIRTKIGLRKVLEKDRANAEAARAFDPAQATALSAAPVIFTKLEYAEYLKKYGNREAISQG